MGTMNERPDPKGPAENNAHAVGTSESGGKVVKPPKTMTDRYTKEKFSPSEDPASPDWVSPREHDDTDD